MEGLVCSMCGETRMVHEQTYAYQQMTRQTELSQSTIEGDDSHPFFDEFSISHRYQLVD